MLDLHLSALDTRFRQHDLRVERANRDGWLPSPAPHSARRTGLGAVLGAVGVHLVPGTWTEEGAQAVMAVATKALATGNGWRSLA